MKQLTFPRRSLSPWFDFSNMHRDVNKLFEDFNKFGPALTDPEKFFAPTCEVKDNDKEYILKFDMPGMTKDQIKIEMDDTTITVSGERKEERKSDDDKVRYSEVSYGTFTRSFAFPTTVDRERVDAQYKDGVLNITVPKTHATKTRSISVK